MTAISDDLPEDLLPDNLNPQMKKTAVPLKRTAGQTKAITKRQAAAAQAAQLKADSVRLAQIVNLHIGGFSLSDIAVSIGASVEEVERLLTSETARYVRSQPALRTYVRNWVSERYMNMIDADYAIATDPAHPAKLEHQDRVMRMLNNMAKLHGAEAPTQAEVKVDAAPEAVEKLVKALSIAQGLDYDDDIFDVDPADIHEAVEVSGNRTQASAAAVEIRGEGESADGF